MRANSFSPKTIKAVLISITMLMLIACVLAIFLWINLPKDVLRENMTLEDAQSLVSFPICLPTYMPLETNPNPQIIYESDAANVPEEAYIRLRYLRLGAEERFFEVYQRYTNDGEMKIAYPNSESMRRKAVITLVWWISSPKLPSSSETNDVLEQVKLETNVFQTNQTVWWIYEILDPREYRSTMTTWIRNHIEYRILSYLPADEIKKTTLSMIECSASNP